MTPTPEQRERFAALVEEHRLLHAESSAQLAQELRDAYELRDVERWRALTEDNDDDNEDNEINWQKFGF